MTEETLVFLDLKALLENKEREVFKVLQVHQDLLVKLAALVIPGLLEHLESLEQPE